MPRYSERTGALQEYQVGPFDSSHVYVQWGGKLPGNESWSCGFRMWKSGGSTNANAVTMLPGISSAIAEFHQRAESSIQSAAKLSFVKVNAIGTNGRYIEDGTNEATFADLPGAYLTFQGPNQVALAVSLTTGFSRGPAHRGRFYMPMPALTPDSSGLIPAAIAAEIGTSVDTLIANANSSGAGHQMVIMSRKAGAPGHRAVTGNEVGRVLDTQRRRRRSLVEDHR